MTYGIEPRRRRSAASSRREEDFEADNWLDGLRPAGGQGDEPDPFTGDPFDDERIPRRRGGDMDAPASFDVPPGPPARGGRRQAEYGPPVEPPNGYSASSMESPSRGAGRRRAADDEPRVPVSRGRRAAEADPVPGLTPIMRSIDEPPAYSGVPELTPIMRPVSGAGPAAAATPTQTPDGPPPLVPIFQPLPADPPQGPVEPPPLTPIFPASGAPVPGSAYSTSGPPDSGGRRRRRSAADEPVDEVPQQGRRARREYDDDYPAYGGEADPTGMTGAVRRPGPGRGSRPRPGLVDPTGAITGYEEARFAGAPFSGPPYPGSQSAPPYAGSQSAPPHSGRPAAYADPAPRPGQPPYADEPPYTGQSPAAFYGEPAAAQAYPAQPGPAPYPAGPPAGPRGRRSVPDDAAYGPPVSPARAPYEPAQGDRGDYGAAPRRDYTGEYRRGNTGELRIDRSGELRERTGDVRDRSGEFPAAEYRTGDVRERTGEVRDRSGEFRDERSADLRERAAGYRERTGDVRERTGDVRDRSAEYRRERSGEFADVSGGGGRRPAAPPANRPGEPIRPPSRPGGGSAPPSGKRGREQPVIDPVRVGQQHRPHRWIAALSVIGVFVLVAACGLGTYFMVSDEKNGGQANAGTTQAPKTRDISSRTADPAPLTEAEVYPSNNVIPVSTEPPYQILKTENSADCTVAAADDLGKLLVTNGCNQVVRATMKSPTGDYLITAGLFNLLDQSAAEAAFNGVKPIIDAQKGRFVGMSVGPNTGTDAIVKAPTQLGWNFRGHFIAYCVIARADGQPFAATDQFPNQITFDIVETYLEGTILGARATVPPTPTPAASLAKPKSS